jgi:hypothetical protein
MKFLLISLMSIAALITLSPCAEPPAAGITTPHQALLTRVSSKPILAVLFVGNSYSFGLPKAFSLLATSHGKQVRCGHSTFGGWTLEQHADSDSTLKKIREGHWDIIVFQEQSEIPAMEPEKRALLMFPPLKKLAHEARTHGAIPVLFQTWGRRDGDAQRTSDTFLTMNQRLREGYHTASKNANGLVVVPVGDAWEREFTAGQGSVLFSEDGSHPSDLGNELIAQAFYQCFWK